MATHGRTKVPDIGRSLIYICNVLYVSCYWGRPTRGGFRWALRLIEDRSTHRRAGNVNGNYEHCLSAEKILTKAREEACRVPREAN